MHISCYQEASLVLAGCCIILLLLILLLVRYWMHLPWGHVPDIMGGSDVLSERLKSAPMEGHWTISRFAVNQSPICRLIEVRLRHDSLCGCEL